MERSCPPRAELGRLCPSVFLQISAISPDVYISGVRLVANGQANWKTAPCGAFGSSQIRPPWAPMIERHVPYAGRPSEPLGIADTSESEVLGISEVLFDITVEQRQLAL